MITRDCWEYENLGQYRKSYPTNDSDLQDKYNAILETAVDVWNEQNGTKPRYYDMVNSGNLGPFNQNNN